jgi:periplasmic divalent cation tolerance protein
MTDACLVLTTVPDAATAESIADRLVAGGLAACVSILPGITSVYVWQGKRCHDTEHQLLIKTAAAAYPALEAAIRAAHPFEVPEILRLPVGGGSAAYLDWINRSVTPPGSGRGSPSE